MAMALAQVRDRLRAIEGERRARAGVLPFGVAALDARMAGGGLRQAALHEVAAAGATLADDAAATLFLAAVAARTAGTVLWVVRRCDLFAPGLYQAGLAPDRLIHVEARDDAELLQLMEDGLRHRGLGAVIGEARRVPMAATRRLQLAAEGGPALALLMRRHGRDGADPLAAPSAAVTRWRIACAPSAPLVVEGQAIEGVGRGRWRLSLVRQRGGEPFDMLMEAADEAGRLALPALVADRPAAAAGGPASRAAA